METVEIRLPELGGNSGESLLRMQSYLYSLAQQLQFAFDSVERQQVQVQERVETAVREAQKTPAENFNAIKALIIKSADIVEAYSEEVERRLAGKYTAESQFGTFRQETQQRIRETSEGITRIFDNVQQIQSAMEGIADQLNTVNAYIKTGLLAYGESGGGVYGVEIGQQESRDGVLCFRKFARLTAERLSFFDSNDAEVAYISDYRLHVTEAAMQKVAAENLTVQRIGMGDYGWFLGSDGHLTLG